MEYIKSTELGYNYLRDRKLINYKPTTINIEKELTGVNFKIKDISKSIENTINKFLESYKKFGYEITEGKLRYGYTSGMDGWPEYSHDKLYVDLIGYETEKQFIERKKKTKRTPEEQELYEYHLQQKEIEKAKETLMKLDKEQLNTVLSELKND